VAAFVLFVTPKPTCAKENVAAKVDAVKSISALLVFIDLKCFKGFGTIEGKYVPKV
jgi:hypothetical protein